MVVSINGDTQKWMVYSGKSHLEMDDLGLSLLQEPPSQIVQKKGRIRIPRSLIMKKIG